MNKLLQGYGNAGADGTPAAHFAHVPLLSNTVPPYPGGVPDEYGFTVPTVPGRLPNQQQIHPFMYFPQGQQGAS